MKRELFYEKFKPLLAINRKLNKYKYGIIDRSTNTVVEDFSDNEFDEKYLPVSTSDFDYYKCGVCWDYSRYYNEKLSKMGYTAINLFIDYGLNKNDFNTHTVTIVELPGIYVWIESAWKDHCGIYLAKDFDALVQEIVNELTVGVRGTCGYVVHDYYDDPPLNYNSKKCMAYYMTSKKILSGSIKMHKTTNGFERVQDRSELLVLRGEPESIVLEEKEDESESCIIFNEATISHTFMMKNLLEKKIFTALDDPVKRKKYARIQSEYMDRNAEKLSTAGPEYLIVFGDSDHKEYLDLFDLDKKEITDTMRTIVRESGITTEFKFLTQHPMLNIFYFCIRYFTLKEDEKGLNSTLAMYALDVYWSTFTKFFPKGVIAPVMAYTIENLTEKFTIKKVHTIFNLLTTSISQSYSFHKKRFYEGADDDITSFAQRIKNDQNSMFRKIANRYMEDWKAGHAITTRNDEYDADSPIVDDVENATTIISTLTAAIVPQMISNGVDLRLAMASAKMSQISVTDCREYLTMLISDKYMPDLESIVQSTLYVFLMNDQRTTREIKSQLFLAWGVNLFKKTNSKDPNITNINSILNKWAEESGIYERYRGKGVRIGYKKAIFIYIILTIQKYA